MKPSRTDVADQRAVAAVGLPAPQAPGAGSVQGTAIAAASAAVGAVLDHTLTGELLVHQLPVAPAPLPHFETREVNGTIQVYSPRPQHDRLWRTRGGQALGANIPGVP